MSIVDSEDPKSHVSVPYFIKVVVDDLEIRDIAINSSSGDVSNVAIFQP